MFLYYLVIYPIRQVLEFCYVLFSEITHSPGLSVIGLSFVVTLCCLPLYIVAESWQEKERILQKSMEKGVKRIKETFKGDEQYMMLSAFYKEHRYHPMMALRSSFGLLIQIPFFIAAYGFLSHLTALQGVRFAFIRDMGKPDALFSIGSFSVNVLPVAMTLLNCVSGAVYSHGHSAREKIQIYVSAALFLVLLYTSPAGLVLYWTMNNLLSLVKNVFYKLRRPLFVLYVLAAAVSLAGIAAALFAAHGMKAELRAIVALFCIVLLASPVLVRLLVRLLKAVFAGSQATAVFLLSALVIAVLTGLSVPSMLMESEPDAFSYVDVYASPFVFLWPTFFKALGLYVLWPVCFYFLFSVRVKQLLTALFSFLACYALVNTFLFSGSYGPLDPTLLFMEPQSFVGSRMLVLANAASAALLLLATGALLWKKRSAFIPVMGILLVALGGIAGKNIASIARQYRNMDAPVIADALEPVFHLSKTGKNVIVFMQDRAFMPFVQEVFKEEPSLAARFDGFVFYKNTVSLGQYTMLGTPGIFGGYSYTPYEINTDLSKTLQQKHNEALLSLPVLFSAYGYDTTVADMPYENYLQQPTSAMYDGYPQVRHISTHGVYSNYWYATHGMEKSLYVSSCIHHNLLMFGIFKTFPPLLRRLVYHAKWWNTGAKGGLRNISRFVDNYSEMDLLPELTDFTAENSTYTAIDNEATHEPILLQAPDYVPVNDITDYGSTKWAHEAQYHAQAGIFRCYARFFDYLRENGVYDNTRIIIVSDHGTALQTDMFDNSTGTPPFLKEGVVATLLVKDFGSHGFDEERGLLNESMEFMTNADTPALATEGLIADAANPFTKAPLKVSDKAPFVKICHPAAESTRIRNNRQYTVPDNGWDTVKDDIFINENWEHIFPFGK